MYAYEKYWSIGYHQFDVKPQTCVSFYCQVRNGAEAVLYQQGILVWTGMSNPGSLLMGYIIL